MEDALHSGADNNIHKIRSPKRTAAHHISKIRRSQRLTHINSRDSLLMTLEESQHHAAYPYIHSYEDCLPVGRDRHLTVNSVTTLFSNPAVNALLLVSTLNRALQVSARIDPISVVPGYGPDLMIHIILRRVVQYYRQTRSFGDVWKAKACNSCKSHLHRLTALLAASFYFDSLTAQYD